jgi:hypothetical protein
MPRALSPVVRLTERFDDALDRQFVALTIDVPLVGRVYEYRGHFRYRIESIESIESIEEQESGA